MILRPFVICSLTRCLLVALLAAAAPLSVLAAPVKVVAVWLTTPAKANLLAEQPERLRFAKGSAGAKAIVIEDGKTFQTMEGFGHALTGGTAQLSIGAPENWSRNVLLWNLAADPQNGPHTNNGGCPVCSGAITLDGDTVVRNLAYYTAAHASKFVPAGSVRIASNGPPDALPHVAFLTPQKRHVLIVSNTTEQESTFSLRFKGKDAIASLPAGAVATYVW